MNGLYVYNYNYGRSDLSIDGNTVDGNSGYGIYLKTEYVRRENLGTLLQEWADLHKWMRTHIVLCLGCHHGALCHCPRDAALPLKRTGG